MPATEIHKRRFWRYNTKTALEAMKRHIFSGFVLFCKQGDLKSFQYVFEKMHDHDKKTLPIYHLIETTVLYKHKDLLLYLLDQLENNCQDTSFLFKMCCKTYFEMNFDVYNIFVNKYTKFVKIDS